MSSPRKLAANVTAFAPQTDPANLDLAAMRQHGWPDDLVDCLAEGIVGSEDLAADLDEDFPEASDTPVYQPR